MLERAQAVASTHATRAVRRSAPEARVALPPMTRRRAIESATPAPVTPIYTELSEILQIELHRALVRSRAARCLNSAAARINVLMTARG